MIVIYSIIFPPDSDGGIASMAYEIANGFSNIGKKVAVITTLRDSKDRKWDIDQNFEIFRLKEKKNIISKIWCRFFSPLKYILKNDVSCIIAMKWNSSGIPSFFLCLFKKIPFYIVVHGNELIVGHTKNPFTKFLKLFILKRARIIFANSSHTMNLVLNMGVKREKIKKIIMGVDPEEFKYKKEYIQIKRELNLNNKKVILTLARLKERKGQDMVIKSLPIVINKLGNDIIYLIAGKGDDKRRLEAIVKGLGLEKFVKFLGYVDSTKLPALYHACDVYCMVSRELKLKGSIEGFGITFLEAAVCGKPVIGGDSGGIRDAVEDGKSGFIVDPLNKNEIASAIIKVLKDREYAKCLGKYGKERVLKKYNWKNSCSKLWNLIGS